MNGSREPDTGGVEFLTIHRAPWVISVVGPPIADGAVAVRGERILEVGKAQEIFRRHRGPAVRVWDHEGKALMPAAVNAHTHLEFSSLAWEKPLTPPGFPQWVLSVFVVKAGQASSVSRQAHEEGRTQAKRTGTVWLGNVVNLPLEDLGPAPDHPYEHRFVELIGFSCKDMGEMFAVEEDSSLGPFSLAAHSLYGTSRSVIRQAKDWTRRRGLPFSIHTAEHREEMQFVREGTGFCRDLLESLGRWDETWRPSGTTPVQTLKALNVLDPRTVLVHMVHAGAEDWDTTARCGACVCFCPRSNRWIEGSLPRIEEALKRSIPCALGTDSRASNEDLNLFREAAAVLDFYAAVEPRWVLRMATYGGARALGVERAYGFLGPGAAAPFLAVPVTGRPFSENELAETVIRQAAQGDVAWIGEKILP